MKVVWEGRVGRSQTLSAPEGREASLALRLKPFEKGFKNSKTFIEEDINVQPRACEQRAPSVVWCMKVLLSILAMGATSPCMGKLRLLTVEQLPQGFRYHHPKSSAEEVNFLRYNEIVV